MNYNMTVYPMRVSICILNACRYAMCLKYNMPCKSEVQVKRVLFEKNKFYEYLWFVGTQALLSKRIQHHRTNGT